MSIEVMKMARKAGFLLWGGGKKVDWSCEYDDELQRFAGLAYVAGAEAERKRIINLLMIQHEAAQGRHNYYSHAALLIEADKGVANDKR